LGQLSKFNSGFKTSLNAGFGGLVGGTTALGAWGLVSLIGSASTGTAISSLSGVAATNATLAWFGGGSLATGGAGMAGGFWVLGGIVAAPVVFFSTKSAYKKVDTVKKQKDKLIEESNKIVKLTAQASAQLQEARKQHHHVTSLMNQYIPKIKKELELYKYHRSFLKGLFGCKMNLEQEKHFNNLNNLTCELLDKLGIK
jgi:membrane protein implicated in regulation of membrane protease activity